jgi:single-strand DNA-binding protein
LANFNRVILMGNLTRDPDMRYTGGGTAVCKIGIAVNRRVKRGDNWEEEANFFDAVIFGKRAEILAKYVGKGDPLLIEGELVQDRWETKEGDRRSKVEIQISDFQFVGRGGGGGGRGSGGGGESRRSEGGGGGNRTYNDAPPPLEDDDIPF